MICLEQLPLPTSIQVRDVTGFDEDDLELYFESSNSGGRDIKNIYFDHKGQCAVIDFDNVTGIYVLSYLPPPHTVLLTSTHSILTQCFTGPTGRLKNNGDQMLLAQTQKE